MDAYAGYYFEEKKVKESSSGGAASAIAEEVIKRGGIVYGAAYSKDFYSATYERAENEEELQKFKGSKYVYVNKVLIRDGDAVSVYKDAISELNQGRTILFTGLGCDITALKTFAEKEGVDTDKLFTIELLCDGVTNEIVHQEYVSNIEKLYDSKVIAFSVRYKKEGWIPLYIYARFENGKEHIQPFYGSDYGFAFLNYKRKCCYDCKFKEHRGDLMVADYWGCRPGMDEYNQNGVSLLFVQNEKGNNLLDYLNRKQFFLKRTNTDYALYYSPRYYTSHERYPQWDTFDKIIREKGLREAVKKCAAITMPERFNGKKINEIILWGAGKCFHQYISLLREMFSISCVIDSNENNWGKELEFGIICQSPGVLKDKKNIVVLITIQNISSAFQVANKLLDMGITEFEHINNWLSYADMEFKNQQ